ncbi:hypothetical protein [Mesobacterium pallidum]|uniref:hypothetical protein n=1 Tax=Mesobacterium pallidum TaxID=2872037 RepID=UPI001EE1B22D|nr:hypothetical protein [Mesobacterium pallidum]
MPTPRQIKEAFEAAKDLCPGARIKGVGPEGVTFEYPSDRAAIDEWSNKPFSGDSA